MVWGLLLEWWGQEGEVDLQLVAEQREIRECICLPLVATLLMGSEVITLQCDQDGMEMDTVREEEDKKYVHLTFYHIKKLIHQLICWLFPLVWHNWYCIPLLLGLLKSDVISKVFVWGRWWSHVKNSWVSSSYGIWNGFGNFIVIQMGTITILILVIQKI